MRGDWVFCLPESTAKEIAERLDPKTRKLIDDVVDVFLGCKENVDAPTYSEEK